MTEQIYAKADRLGDEGQKKHLFLGKAACHGCPIRCSQMGAVRTGKHAHLITDIVEYESAALMGSNLDIHDVRAVAHLVKLCDTYGLDSMSTGGVIAFAFEAAEKNLIRRPRASSWLLAAWTARPTSSGPSPGRRRTGASAGPGCQTGGRPTGAGE